MAKLAISFQRALEALSPNRQVARPSRIGAAVASAAGFVAAWQLWAGVLPGPREVAVALAHLWTERGLFDALCASLLLNTEAIAWSAAIALALAYLTVIPALRPIVSAATKLRFTGLVGWAFVFTLW